MNLSTSVEMENYVNSTTSLDVNNTMESIGSENFTDFFTQINLSTTPSAEASNQYAYLTEISKDVKKFCYLTLFLVGTIGNIFTVVILSLKKNRKTSTAMFLLFLAASDTMILFTSYFSVWLNIVWNFSLREINSVTCKIHIFLTYSSLQFSAWILVLVTCERCISVINPAKVKIICSHRNGMAGLGAIALFIALLNTHWLVGITQEFNPYVASNCAGSSPSYIKFLNEVFPINDFCVTFAIPCLIIMVGNSIIILQITRASRARSQFVASDKKKNISSLTVTLVILNIIFIISMGPASIYLLTYHLTIESQDSEQITLAFFVFDMVNLFAGLNATVNFILYFLSGSKFRADVKALLCCKQAQLHGMFDRSTKKLTISQPK